MGTNLLYFTLTID